MTHDSLSQRSTETRRGQLVQLGTLDGLLAWYEDLVPCTGGGFRRVLSGGTLNRMPISREELAARIEHARSKSGERFWF